MAVVYVNIGVTLKWLVAYLAGRYLQVGFDLLASEAVLRHAVVNAPTAGRDLPFDITLVDTFFTTGPDSVAASYSFVELINRQLTLALTTSLHAPSTDLPSPWVRLVYGRSSAKSTAHIGWKRADRLPAVSRESTVISAGAAVQPTARVVLFSQLPCLNPVTACVEVAQNPRPYSRQPARPHNPSAVYPQVRLAETPFGPI
jgi:hypothetical protein